MGAEERHRQGRPRNDAPFDASLALIGENRFRKMGCWKGQERKNPHPRPNGRHARRKLTLEYARVQPGGIHGQEEEKDEKQEQGKQSKDEDVEKEESRTAPQESRAEAESRSEAREQKARSPAIATCSDPTRAGRNARPRTGADRYRITDRRQRTAVLVGKKD
jgi:hypothetical protein